ncbi:MAG: hypothetical protein LBK75_01030, partial [Oscillospiraceae bacterium]|nr:hypothetical protein [Oscillospiraceae bacterium]
MAEKKTRNGARWMPSVMAFVLLFSLLLTPSWLTASGLEAAETAEVQTAPAEDAIETPAEDVAEAPEEETPETPEEDAAEAPEEDAAEAPEEEIPEVPPVRAAPAGVVLVNIYRNVS